MRRVLRRSLLVTIAVLYALSIPWFREPGTQTDVWLGLPEWTAVSLLCFVGVAIANAWAWLLTDISDAHDEIDDEPPRGGP